MVKKMEYILFVCALSSFVMGFWCFKIMWWFRKNCPFKHVL